MSIRIRFVLFALLALLSTCAFCQRPGVPGLKLVGKDYTNVIPATDRNWFYLDSNGDPLSTGGGQYPAVELLPGRAYEVTNIVDLKSSSFDIDLTFENQASIAFAGTLVPMSAKLVIAPGNEVPLTISGGGAFSMGISPATGGTSVTISGLPASVAKGELVIEFEVHGNTGIQVAGQSYSMSYATNASWATLYVVDSTPKGLQAVPWTDLLFYACKWASTKSGNVDVATAVTRGLYWSTYFAYNIGSDITSQYVIFPSRIFKLKDMLVDWHQPGATSANCVDVSFCTELLCKALGIDASCQRIYEIDEEDFITNPFCPIGSDATNVATYRNTIFSFHQQARVETNVFDAAIGLEFDLSGAVFKNAPANWDVFEYWQKFGVSNHPVLGLTYRKALPTDLPMAGWGFTPDPNYGPSTVNNIGYHTTLTGIN